MLRTKKARKVLFQKILRTNLQICPSVEVAYPISKYLTFQHKKAVDMEQVAEIKLITTKMRVNWIWAA